jgi:hypothetical protein
MLTLGRLALLEERRAGPGAGEGLWEQAEQFAVAGGLTETSRANIRKVIARLDASNATQQ